MARIFSSLLMVGIFFSPFVSSVYADETPVEGSTFVESIVSFPNHVNRTSSTQQQTALKDGDVVDIAAMLTGPVPTTSVTVDATGLDGATILHLSGDPSFTNTSYPYPLQYYRGSTVTVSTGGRTGTTSVTFTAINQSGATTTKVVDIILDQQAPALTFTNIERTGTTSLTRADTLYYSGSLDGTGSGARIYSILGEGLAEDAITVVYGSYFNWNHPQKSDLYNITGESFTHVALPLSGAYSGAEYPDNMASIRFVFTIEDDAGHVAYATSGPAYVAPPEVPVATTTPEVVATSTPPVVTIETPEEPTPSSRGSHSSFIVKREVPTVPEVVVIPPTPVAAARVAAPIAESVTALAQPVEAAPQTIIVPAAETPSAMPFVQPVPRATVESSALAASAYGAFPGVYEELAKQLHLIDPIDLLSIPLLLALTVLFLILLRSLARGTRNGNGTRNAARPQYQVN